MSDGALWIVACFHGLQCCIIEHMFDMDGLDGRDEEVAEIAAAVDRLAAADSSGLSNRRQVHRLRALGRLIDRLEGERLRLLGQVEASGAARDDGAVTTAAWLRANTSLTVAEAARTARLARRLRDLPVIAAALREGAIGVNHGTAIDRLAGDVGVDQVAAVQHELLTAAAELRTVTEFQRLCDGWRHALAPDARDAADDRAWQARRLSGSATIDGRYILTGSFDAQAGATIATALDALSWPDPPDTPPELRRTATQRRADALTELARRFLDSGDAGEHGGVRPHVTATVDLRPDPDTAAPTVAGGDLDWIGPIGPRTCERIMADSDLTRVLTSGASRILDVGTATRVWPTGIRRAIVTRDRRCRFPGCDRPPQWCDIDHVVPVAQQGSTSLSNGILLCRVHHRAKLRDGWWPTLHDDGTVEWNHADGRVRLDRPPGHTRDLADQLTATAATRADTSPTHRDRVDAAREHPPRYRTDQPPRGDPMRHPPSGSDPGGNHPRFRLDPAA